MSRRGKGKDYMNNYFMSKYGAIRDIDLSDIFKKFVENGDAPITNNKYFFSVEGETEELYFKHLKHLILAEEGRIANPALSVYCVIKKILSECEG